MTARLGHRSAGRSRRWALALAVAGGVLGTVVVAAALDPSRPEVMVVGGPAGFAPRDRLGSARLGLSRAKLPRAPLELWRHELPGALDHLPLVDAAGNIVAVLANRIVLGLSPDGTEQWRTSLGAADAVVPAVLTSDGSAAILCSDAKVRWLSAAGAMRVSPELDMVTRKVQATPLALDDGSVIVAGESELVRVSPDGSVAARVELPAIAVGGLIDWQGAVLATLDTGQVVAWRAPGRALTVGSFGGPPNGGALLASPTTLLAVVEARALVALDLHSGQPRLLAGGPGSTRQFEGPPTLSATGTVLVATVVGELLAIDAHGTLTRRIALDNAVILDAADGGAAAASFFGRMDLQPSPPLVVDEEDRIGFVRGAGRLGVIDPRAGSGGVVVASPRFCARPVGVTSAGAGRMLVACRNGSIGVFGDSGS